ncbi:MAG TPA: hypothetical protein DCZ49_07580 [Hyphomonadaceae bacterium]|nr:hypothetical protein [Hyphomonadaceae bacterium]
MVRTKNSCRLRLAAMLIIASLATVSAQGTAKEKAPTPDFVATKELAYCRRAPALSAPLVWVFTRRGVPLRVLSKDDDWFYIEDADGARCWVNERIVTLGAFAIVRAEAAVAGLAGPKNDAQLRAKLEPGVIGRIIACADDWRKLEIADGQAVWAPRSAFWGKVDACSSN